MGNSSSTMADNNVLKALVMLPETLVPGRSIRIRGFIPQNANRIQMNLQHGAGDYTDDIALHFDVRFQQNMVVRNHFVRGKGWVGREETDGGMPFRRNGKFEVIFTVEQNGIRVTANGAPFTTFNHRLPFTAINHLRIHRDVDIRLITFEEGY